MCGILGIMRLGPDEPVESSLLEKMSDILVHRGPDKQEYLLDNQLGLAFQRLGIIDLVSGDQPMTNEDGSLWLACNGEIFNYLALRNELLDKGHVFRSRTDVEVLLHLYEEEGLAMFDRLNGQFAFALYNQTDRHLLLARDHFGINPLFYTVVGHTLIFASEIKAILAHPKVARRVNLTALDQLLSLPGVISPITMFEGIYSLPPGHFLEVREHNLSVRQYWDLTFPRLGEIDYGHPESYYRELVREKLIQSIRYRLQADVPVGAYLSGGLDSSAIVGIVSRETTFPLTTFSIDFHDPNFSEGEYQRVMSAHTGFPHHEIGFGGEDITTRLERVVWHAEVPLKESYNTASHALSESVRDRGVRVTLCGEGADELFAGYPGYRFDAFRQNASTNRLSGPAAVIHAKLWGDPQFIYEKNQYEFRAVKQSLFSKQLKGLHPRFDFVNHGVVSRDQLVKRHILHKRSYLDLKLRLAHHLLADHGDRMTMAHSVEGRYPFLDIDLVNAVREMPPGLMVRDFKEKYLLKQAVKPYVPQAILDREKFPFSAPGSPDLLRQHNPWLDQLLSPATIARQGYFDVKTVERLKQRYRQPGFRVNVPYEDDLLMVVLSFGIFLNVFQMPDL